MKGRASAMLTWPGASPGKRQAVNAPGQVSIRCARRPGGSREFCVGSGAVGRDPRHERRQLGLCWWRAAARSWEARAEVCAALVFGIPLRGLSGQNQYRARHETSAR